MRGLVLLALLSLSPAAVARAQPSCERTLAEARALSQRGLHAQSGNVLVRYAQEQRQCGHLDAALYGAGAEYYAAGLVGRALRVWLVLLGNFPDSPLARNALFRTAGGYHAIASYAEAAAYYARFARTHPGADGADCTDAQRTGGTCPIASVAMQNAVFFQISLGDFDGALASVSFTEEHLARSSPRLAVTTTAGLAARLAASERYDEAAALDERLLRDHSASLSRSEELGALLRLARARLRADDEGGATELFERMEARFRGEPAFVPAASERELDRVRAQDALAEARILALDAPHARLLETLTPPASPARFTPGSLQQYAEGPFVTWLADRVAAIEALAEPYHRVSELAIPEWEIVAAERLAGLHARLAAELETLGATPVSGAEGDALTELRAPITTARAAHRRRAEDLFAFCSRTAVRVRWLDGTSQRCFEALDALHGSPSPAELHAEAEHTGPRGAEPPPASR